MDKCNSKTARCVIIGGADISDYASAKRYLKADDFLIFCDSGLSHAKSLNATPDLTVGDFDSHKAPQLPCETIVLPREKDDTDTVYAVKEAVKRGFNDFLLMGVIGARLDHTLGNVSALLYLSGLGKHAVIVDDYSEMEIVSKTAALVDSRYCFFSLLNISGTAHGITVKNAKYPLTDASIECNYQYGISNEVLPGKTAEITVKEGCLLLIKVKNSFN